MAVYKVKLKREINLEEAIIPLRSYYTNNIAPLSRGHSLELTEEQAEIVRQLPNVETVELGVESEFRTYVTQTGNFVKVENEAAPGTAVTPNPNTIAESLNWALYDSTMHPTDDWGVNPGRDDGQPDYSYFLNGTADFHSLGEHVDIIITDTPVPHDAPDLAGRFIQFDWHTLTDYVRDELRYPDTSRLLTDTYTYCNHAEHYNVTNQGGLGPDWPGDDGSDHGYHVATTAAGSRNGFAKQANLYSISLPFSRVTEISSQTYLYFSACFFYIRAFHLTKPINPITGRKNPTIVNCSWGGGYWLGNRSFSEITSVTTEGITYSPGNPFPNGWDDANLAWETGNFLFDVEYADPEYLGYQDDCAEDGIILVAAAGNSSQKVANPGHPHYNDNITFNDGQVVYIHRNQWSSALTVGAIGNERPNNNDGVYSRAVFSNYGSGVDVFAPGSNIIASVSRSIDGYYWADQVFSSTNEDTNYGTDSEGNKFSLRPYNGTSMAAPQVAGVLACHASSTTKSRYTLSDAKNYTQNTSKTDRLQPYTDYWYYDEIHDVEYPSTNIKNRPNVGHNPIYSVSSYTLQDLTVTGWVWTPNGGDIPMWREDIYGNDIASTDPYVSYEGWSGEFRFLNEDSSTNYFYDTNPFALKTSNTTGDTDRIPDWLGESGEEQYGFRGESSMYVGAETIGLLTPSTNDIYLQDTTDLGRYKTFTFLTPPDDILNYKYANRYFLGDSNMRTLSCESTRPTDGQITQTEGERTSGCVYPRGSKVYS